VSEPDECDSGRGVELSELFSCERCSGIVDFLFNDRRQERDPPIRLTTAQEELQTKRSGIANSTANAVKRTGYQFQGHEGLGWKGSGKQTGASR